MRCSGCGPYPVRGARGRPATGVGIKTLPHRSTFLDSQKKRMPGPLTPFWVQTLLTVQVRPDSQTLSPQVTFFKRLDINHLWG